MKYLAGFGAAVLVIILLKIMQDYVVPFEIPKFLFGFFSAAAFYQVKHLYE